MCSHGGMTGVPVSMEKLHRNTAMMQMSTFETAAIEAAVRG